MTVISGVVSSHRSGSLPLGSPLRTTWAPRVASPQGTRGHTDSSPAGSHNSTMTAGARMAAPPGGRGRWGASPRGSGGHTGSSPGDWRKSTRGVTQVGHRLGGGDDHWRGRIRRPVGVPVRPDGHPKARPEDAGAAMAEAMVVMAEAMVVMPKAMMAVPAAVAPMPTAVAPPRGPWHRTRHEPQDQQPEQHGPQWSRACGLIRVAHRVPRPPAPVCWPWKTPRPLLPSPGLGCRKSCTKTSPWCRSVPVCAWSCCVRLGPGRLGDVGVSLGCGCQPSRMRIF